MRATSREISLPSEAVPSLERVLIRFSRKDHVTLRTRDDVRGLVTHLTKRSLAAAGYLATGHVLLLSTCTEIPRVGEVAAGNLADFRNWQDAKLQLELY